MNDSLTSAPFRIEPRGVRPLRFAALLLLALAVTLLATLLLLYLARIQVPRIAWLTLWTMTLPFLLLNRALFWHIHRWLNKRSIVKTSAIIYGTGSPARMLLKHSLYGDAAVQFRSCVPAVRTKTPPAGDDNA